MKGLDSASSKSFIAPTGVLQKRRALLSVAGQCGVAQILDLPPAVR